MTNWLRRWAWVLAGGALISSAALFARPAPREVGAWTLVDAVLDPARTIAQAQAAGVNRLCVFVNTRPGIWDSAGKLVQWATPWNIRHSTATIKAAVEAFHAAGLAVSLVSWMTPRPDWIAGARDLAALATTCGVDEIDLDLEEQWTVLKTATDTAIADVTAQLFRNLRDGFRGRVVVDCIVYTDLRVLGPAIRASDGVIPQAYATRNNAHKLAPGELERIAYARFAPFGKPIIMGVAGWNQEGAYRVSHYVDAMRVSLATIRELGVQRIRVWWLPTLDRHEAAELTAWRNHTTTTRPA